MSDNVGAATYRAFGQNSLRVKGCEVTVRVSDYSPGGSRKIVASFQTDLEAQAFLKGAQYACDVFAGWENRWPRVNPVGPPVQSSGGTSAV